MSARSSRIAVVVGAALLVAASAHAQSEGKGFLFKRPIGSFAIRGGFDRALAQSDIFDFVTDTLTLGKGDFGAFSVGADLSFRINSRVDVVIGADYAGSSAKSEFKNWVDNDDRPIEQTTTFRRIPFTAGLKAYLTSRGQSVGNFAWVPTKIAPFVGVGGGMEWYRFKQEGDFVDFDSQNFDVFGDTFQSQGWTPTVHALAGLDYSLGPRFVFTTQGKYTRAKADMSADFDGFDKIDLSGFAATLGFYVRF